MKKVPFATVHHMHRELHEELSEAFQMVLKSDWFIRGEACRSFEQSFASYCHAEHCVGVASGLDAITLTLMAWGIGRGDEVIVPANTFIATALAVSFTGAQPVFAEPDIRSFNINPDGIEQCITDRTRCIIAVHLQGRPADMETIKSIAQKHGLLVMEDAAQAHGSCYNGTRVGTLSDAAAFSFYPGKNLGALGDAGCVITNNKETAERIRELGNYGSAVRYHHRYKGLNSRLDEMQAALLSVKLPHLDEWNNERKEIASCYLQGIRNPLIELPLSPDEVYDHIYHVFAVRCPNRDDLEAYLNQKGIETNKHYPVPVPLQPAYEEMGFRKGDFPVAEEISNTILSIPIYNGMCREDIQYVIDCINTFSA